MVIATQNPIEQAGTYRLPEAQLDRFLMKTSVGYPDSAATIRILSDAKVRDRARRLQPVVTAGVVGDMAALADEVYVDPALLAYVTSIAEASRRHPSLKLGLSVRGCLAYVRCAKTWAASQGRTYVIPDDIKMLAVPVLSHRLLLDAEAQFSGTTVIQVIEQILGDVPPPVQGSGQAPASARYARGRVGRRQTRRYARDRRYARRRRRRTRPRRGRCTAPRTPTPTDPHLMTAPTAYPDAPATRRARREAARRQAGWRGRVDEVRGRLRQAGRTLAERTRPVWRPVATGLRWVSPLGWAILALGVLCWYVGVRFGWVELLVVAAACGILVVACVALTIGRVHVDIQSEVDPRRVTVGDPATGRVAVRNLARTPLLPLLVELPVGVTAARFVMPPLRAGGEHEELFVVPTHRRGVIAVGPARTVRGDPLGVLRRTVEFTQVQELFVHPRTAHLESLGAGLLRDLEGTVTEDHSMSDLAFHALREYQPGDDRRYIHWRSSAKAGRLLVRQFLDTRRSHVTVLVDTDPRSYTGGEDILDEWTGEHTEPLVAAHSAPEVPDLEAAISIGASIVLRVMRDEQDTTIVCGSHDISREHPPDHP